MISFNESLTNKLERYAFYASPQAKKYLYYPISIGQFNCREDYECSSSAEQGYFLIFLIKGEMTLSINSEKYKLTQNALVITNANTVQTYFATSSNVEYVFLNFGGENAEALLSLVCKNVGFIIHPENPKIIRKNLRNIFLSLKEKKILTESQISSKIYEILCECLIPSKKEIAMELNYKGDYKDIVSFAEQYIIENINTPLTVKLIAKQVHMSTSHFSKLFKIETGYSPYDYVLNTRLQKAKDYLRDTDKSIAQIAFLTGFNSESNFVYFFTTNTGVSPLKYRKQNFI